MRFALTESESALWAAIRGRRLGVQFRRQVPVGDRFIADFLAPREMLIVEVDGPCHARRRARDACRDKKLRRWGYRVLRLDAQLVLRELPVALGRIREALGLEE
jgi:cyclase